MAFCAFKCPLRPTRSAAEEKLQCSTSGSAASELEGCSQAEVRTLVHASVAEIEAACRDFAPNLVYIRGACVGAASSPSSLTVASYRAASPDGMAVDGDSAEGGVAVDAAALCAAVCDSTRPLHCLYLDFQGADAAAAEAHQTGAATMAVAWASAPAPAAAPAALFARAFFASLRHPGAAVQEAYALALATTYAQCARSSGAARVAPSVPLFLHNSPPQLPGPVSVPLSTISGMHPRVIVPAFDTIRLATPRADARLLLAGAAGVSEVPRLACVAEALRAALVMEARGAKVLSAHAPTVTLFSPDVSAVQCSVQTAGGAVVEVLLCGDAGALANETARDHALRQCLAADAMHVQLRVPPRGGQFLGWVCWCKGHCFLAFFLLRSVLVPSCTPCRVKDEASPMMNHIMIAPPQPPVPRSSRSSRKSTAVAAGADTVEVISVMSVWCAHCLEQLAARRDARLLPALGVAAVLGTPTASFTAADAELFAAALAFSSAGVPEAPADAPGDKLVGAHGQVLPLPPTFLANGLNAALSSKGERRRGRWDGRTR